MRQLTAGVLCLLLLVGAPLGAKNSATGGARPARSRLSFARAITFATAIQGPTSIAAGDLNHDGLPDIAVVSPDGGGNYPYVSYAPGKGNGRFGPWKYGPATNAPGFVLLAHATENGKLDALTTDTISNDIAIAFGDGKGGFSSYVDITNVFANFLAVADVNGDKIPDIVGSGISPNSVYVMLGQGKKKFGQPTTYPSGGDFPTDVATGSLRNDGIQDMLVANYGSMSGGNENIGVLLGNGDGTFQNPVVYEAGPRPLAVVLGDFNGDGNLDVAVSNNGGADVLLGSGDGTFAAAKMYRAGGSPTWIAAADFNGDGILDLAVSNLSNTGTGYVAVLLGNGDGTFQRPRRFDVGRGPWQLVVADFNHDGRPDIATVNNGDSSVSVLLNTTKFPVHPKRQH
jgi:hypothetical protein